MADVDQIDYREGGYWHENKSTWGIRRARRRLLRDTSTD